MKSLNSKKIKIVSVCFMLILLSVSSTILLSQPSAYARTRSRDIEKKEAEARAANENIVFGDFKSSYNVKTDEAGNIYIDVVETIESTFIRDSINHGIERAIPKSYDRRVVLKKDSFKSYVDGSEVTHSLDRVDNNNAIYRIGDSDKFVTGYHKYILKYQLYNALKNNNNSQLLYLNANGTEWKRPFTNISSTVFIDSSIKSKLSGEFKCYFGVLGLSSECDSSERTEKDGGVLFSFSNKSSFIGENLTFIISFQPNSFVQSQLLFDDYLTIILAIISGVIFTGLLVLFVIACLKRKSIKQGNLFKESVIPQYLPPKIDELDILEASKLLNSTKGMSSAVMFLAVNGNIQIKENISKGILKNRINYSLIKDDIQNNLNKDMVKFMSNLFGSSNKVNLSKKLPESQAKSIGDQISRTSFLKTSFYDHRKFKSISASRNMSGVFIVIFIIGVLSMGFLSEILSTTSVFFGYLLMLCFASFIISMISISFTSKEILSKKGYEMLNYLEGLKLYISVAEQDRIKFNQGLETSERFQQEFGGSKIKLYEKLLPWAILFGLEKSWSKVLEIEFTNEDYQPVWYYGVLSMNMQSFSNSINLINSSLNSYYASSSGSSSGGGGGFSGGGAGGGGGGGW